MVNSRITHIVILVLLALGVYMNSIGGEFVFDDKPMIPTYDLVKDINNLPSAFVSPTSLYGNTNYYRPLQTVANMLDYFMWGRVTVGFHITNILFHLMAVLLVYVFICLLFKERILGFLTAIIFAVHPVHTGVVSYIAGRADSMLCVFLLAGFIFYVLFRYIKGNIFSYAASMLFFILALLTKELAMIIPVTYLCFDLYARRFTDLERPKKKGYYIVPFFVILGLYLFFRITRMSFFVEGAIPPFPFNNRLITVPHVIAQYLRLIVWPNDLHMGREPWVAGSLFNDRVLVSLFVIGILFLAAYFLRNKDKRVWFGSCWFLFMMIPALNVITPLFSTIAENWLYIPSIGLFLIIAVIINRIYKKASASFLPYAKYMVVCCFAAYIGVMGVITVIHNKTWKDEIALGMNTLKFNPREFKVWNNIGVVYLGRGDLDDAEDAFNKCLEIKPDTGMACFNLYRIYSKRGQRAKALEYLAQARKYDPKRVGIIIEKMGIKD